MEFQIGDIFLLRGTSFISKFIRLLISVRYGLRYRDSDSHIESAYTKNENVSAESKGTVIVPNNQDPKAEYTVYRLRDMDAVRQKNHREIADKYIGGGYAYIRYILDAIRIITFFMIPVIIIFSLFNWLWAVIGGGLILGFLTFGRRMLMKIDKKTWDCSELQSMIFTENGFYQPLSDRHRDEHPNGMRQWLEIMCLYKTADLIAIKKPKEDYVFLG